MWDERVFPSGGDPWEWLLFRQHGVVARSQIVGVFSAKAIEHRLASRVWQAPHRGVYVTHNGPLTPQQRLWAASLAVGNGTPALLGGLSALAAQGLSRFTADAIHILLPATRKDRDAPAGVRVHRTSQLPETDIDAKADPPCTQPARSVVDAAQWARSDYEARTIIAMSFQQRLVGGSQVKAVIDRFKVIKRRSLIAQTAADAGEGSETVTELDLARLCRDHGLPTPTRQVVRTDSTGRKRYLDAFFDEWRLVVEVDGAHHMEADQWWRDMRRHNSLSVRGEVLLRFPGWLLRDRPEEVAAALRDALLSAGWRP